VLDTIAEVNQDFSPQKLSKSPTKGLSNSPKKGIHIDERTISAFNNSFSYMTKNKFNEAYKSKLNPLLNSFDEDKPVTLMRTISEDSNAILNSPYKNSPVKYSPSKHKNNLSIGDYSYGVSPPKLKRDQQN
jgi:hypothetical protein